jgi:hypothetical protein
VQSKASACRIPHVGILEKDIADFLQKNPIEVTPKRNAEWREYSFYVSNVPATKGEWSLIIGDCLHNARSTLDHLAYQLAMLHLGRELSEDEARLINFPVSPNERSYQRASTRPVWMTPETHHVPQEARKLGVFVSSNHGSPMGEGAKIGTWHFDREPPEELPTSIDVAEQFPLNVSLGLSPDNGQSLIV